MADGLQDAPRHAGPGRPPRAAPPQHRHRRRDRPARRRRRPGRAPRRCARPAAAPAPTCSSGRLRPPVLTWQARASWRRPQDDGAPGVADELSRPGTEPVSLPSPDNLADRLYKTTCRRSALPVPMFLDVSPGSPLTDTGSRALARQSNSGRSCNPIRFEAETDPAATLRLAVAPGFPGRSGWPYREGLPGPAITPDGRRSGCSARRHRQLPGAGTRSYPPVNSPLLRPPPHSQRPSRPVARGETPRWMRWNWTGARPGGPLSGRERTER